MQTLQPSAEIVEKVLNPQKPSDGTVYRPMTYCVLCQRGKGVLVYNVLTKSLVSLSVDEAEVLNKPFIYHDKEASESVRQLISMRYLVPDNHNDYQAMKELRQLSKLIGSGKEKTKTYTILTTTDCNARCFYCYEKGQARIRMTEQTAHQVAESIEDKKINIQWFGGEPLYNHPAIDIICEDLQQKGCEYSAMMVTNAYLFNEVMVQKAVNLWHLKKVQVTLDGTEPVYNRCKAYIYKEGSAYQRVLRNIGLLLGAGIVVNLRLNIDMHNADDLLLLIDELKTRFEGKKGLTVYSHTIFEETLKEARSEEQRKLLYAKQDLLNERIRQVGFAAKKKLSKEIMVNHCKVDSGTCEMILPDGHIGLCEHFTDDHFIGHISSKERDNAAINQQCETIEDPACRTCPVLPDCIRLKICENNQVCYPEDRERKIRSIKDIMADFHCKNTEEK